MVKIEIQTQVATANQYPRDVKRAITQIRDMAMASVEIAASMSYEQPGRTNHKTGKKGDPIIGPSIRALELFSGPWRNLRIGSQILEVSEAKRMVKVRGVCWDMENNVIWDSEVSRRITAGGDDGIALAIGSGSSIAMRNATKRTIGPMVDIICQECREFVERNSKVDAKDKLFEYFASLTPTPLDKASILKILDIEAESDLTPKHIARMRALAVALKEGFTSVERELEELKPKHAAPQNATREGIRAAGRAQEPQDAQPVAEPTQTTAEPESAPPEPTESAGDPFEDDHVDDDGVIADPEADAPPASSATESPKDAALREANLSEMVRWAANNGKGNVQTVEDFERVFGIDPDNTPVPELLAALKRVRGDDPEPPKSSPGRSRKTPVEAKTEPTPANQPAATTGAEMGTPDERLAISSRISKAAKSLGCVKDDGLVDRAKVRDAAEKHFKRELKSINDLTLAELAEFAAALEA
jgi:hypothetical protein